MQAHPTSASLFEVAGACLHMLSGVNNIVRRMILRMEIVPKMLGLCGQLVERQGLHAVSLGLTVQLSKGDLSCAQLFAMQVSTAQLLAIMQRFPDAADIQADGARALAPLVSTEKAVLTLAAEDGLAQLVGVAEKHGSGSVVENEVINVLEQAVCAMCEAIDEEVHPPRISSQPPAALPPPAPRCSSSTTRHATHHATRQHSTLPWPPSPTLSPALTTHSSPACAFLSLRSGARGRTRRRRHA